MSRKRLRRGLPWIILGAGALVVLTIFLIVMIFPVMRANKSVEFENVLVGTSIYVGERLTFEQDGTVRTLPGTAFHGVMGILRTSPLSRQGHLFMPPASTLDTTGAVTIKLGENTLYIAEKRGAQDIVYAKLTYGRKNFVVSYRNLGILERVKDALGVVKE